MRLCIIFTPHLPDLPTGNGYNFTLDHQLAAYLCILLPWMTEIGGQGACMTPHKFHRNSIFAIENYLNLTKF